MTSDEEYMEEAVRLAKKGLGKTSPNPVVGCLIVKNGEIIGRGYHEKAGEAHAEVNALGDAGEKAEGSTMYVTLEPCRHHGKTPPCTDAIIEAGIARVVVGREDPNPKISGKGIAELQRAGIEVESGIKGEYGMINEMYEKYITTKQPFVIVKAALTADGKIAAKDGSSKWISGEDSRKAVHELRNQVDAVMVGIGTVLADDPELTCKLEGCKSPVRIILDSKLRIRADANVLNNAAKTIIVTTHDAPLNRIDALRKRGIEVLVVDTKGGKIHLRGLLKDLALEEITSIMIEGGGEVISSALEEGVVDKVMLFIAPQILGGEGKGINGRDVKNIKETIHLERTEMKKVGEDFLLTGYPKR